MEFHPLSLYNLYNYKKSKDKLSIDILTPFLDSKSKIDYDYLYKVFFKNKKGKKSRRDAILEIKQNINKYFNYSVYDGKKWENKNPDSIDESENKIESAKNSGFYQLKDINLLSDELRNNKKYVAELLKQREIIIKKIELEKNNNFVGLKSLIVNKENFKKKKLSIDLKKPKKKALFKFIKKDYKPPEKHKKKSKFSAVSHSKNHIIFHKNKKIVILRPFNKNEKLTYVKLFDKKTVIHEKHEKSSNRNSLKKIKNILDYDEVSEIDYEDGESINYADSEESEESFTCSWIEEDENEYVTKNVGKFKLCFPKLKIQFLVDQEKCGFKD